MTSHAWRALEVLLALAVIALLASVLLSKVSYSGSWDGDPALRNRLAMETVNYFVAQWSGGGNPALAFLQAFHRYPTIAHESMLAIFILFANGFKPVDFDTVVLHGAWFSTVWTLIGALVLYRAMRLFSARYVALLVLPMCVLTGYILLYANFPRQNMMSHVLGWIAFAVYLYSRTESSKLANWRVFVIGSAFGLSVPTHYSSTYLGFFFVAAEVILALVQRSGARVPLWNLCRLFSAALAVWLIIDVYFYLATWLHPEIVSFDGVSPRTRNYGFLSGMLHAASRLATEAASYKLEDQVWWFMPGFLYNNFGIVGSVLMFFGLVDLIRKVFGNIRRQGQAEQQTGELIVLVAVLVSVIVSLGYFQNARKLMVFYPAWCCCLLYGFKLAMSLATISGVNSSQSGGIRAVASSSIIAIGIIALHVYSYFPGAKAVYEYRRDFGLMKEYIGSQGIRDLLVYTRPADSPEDIMRIAENQKVLNGLSSDEADKYQFVMIYRLYRGTDAAVMDKLKGIKPLYSVNNQNALALAWYEFPLKKGFADFTDPLTHSRSLYRWSDVRSAFYPSSPAPHSVFP